MFPCSSSSVRSSFSLVLFVLLASVSFSQACSTFFDASSGLPNGGSVFVGNATSTLASQCSIVQVNNQNTLIANITLVLDARYDTHPIAYEFGPALIRISVPALNKIIRVSFLNIAQIIVYFSTSANACSTVTVFGSTTGTSYAYHFPPQQNGPIRYGLSPPVSAPSSCNIISLCQSSSDTLVTGAVQAVLGTGTILSPLQPLTSSSSSPLSPSSSSTSSAPTAAVSSACSITGSSGSFLHPFNFLSRPVIFATTATPSVPILNSQNQNAFTVHDNERIIVTSSLPTSAPQNYLFNASEVSVLDLMPTIPIVPFSPIFCSHLSLFGFNCTYDVNLPLIPVAYTGFVDFHVLTSVSTANSIKVINLPDTVRLVIQGGPTAPTAGLPANSLEIDNSASSFVSFTGGVTTDSVTVSASNITLLEVSLIDGDDILSLSYSAGNTWSISTGSGNDVLSLFAHNMTADTGMFIADMSVGMDSVALTSSSNGVNGAYYISLGADIDIDVLAVNCGQWFAGFTGDIVQPIGFHSSYLNLQQVRAGDQLFIVQDQPGQPPLSLTQHRGRTMSIMQRAETTIKVMTTEDEEKDSRLGLLIKVTKKMGLTALRELQEEKDFFAYYSQSHEQTNSHSHSHYSNKFKTQDAASQPLPAPLTNIVYINTNSTSAGAWVARSLVSNTLFVVNEIAALTALLFSIPSGALTPPVNWVVRYEPSDVLSSTRLLVSSAAGNGGIVQYSLVRVKTPSITTLSQTIQASGTINGVLTQGRLLQMLSVDHLQVETGWYTQTVQVVSSPALVDLAFIGPSYAYNLTVNNSNAFALTFPSSVFPAASPLGPLPSAPSSLISLPLPIVELLGASCNVFLSNVNLVVSPGVLVNGFPKLVVGAASAADVDVSMMPNAIYGNGAFIQTQPASTTTTTTLAQVYSTFLQTVAAAVVPSLSLSSVSSVPLFTAAISNVTLRSSVSTIASPVVVTNINPSLHCRVLTVHAAAVVLNYLSPLNAGSASASVSNGVVRLSFGTASSSSSLSAMVLPVQIDAGTDVKVFVPLKTISGANNTSNTLYFDDHLLVSPTVSNFTFASSLSPLSSDTLISALTGASLVNVYVPLNTVPSTTNSTRNVDVFSTSTVVPSLVFSPQTSVQAVSVSVGMMPSSSTSSASVNYNINRQVTLSPNTVSITGTAGTSSSLVAAVSWQSSSLPLTAVRVRVFDGVVSVASTSLTAASSSITPIPILEIDPLTTVLSLSLTQTQSSAPVLFTHSAVNFNQDTGLINILPSSAASVTDIQATASSLASTLLSSAAAASASSSSINTCIVPSQQCTTRYWFDVSTYGSNVCLSPSSTTSTTTTTSSSTTASAAMSSQTTVVTTSTTQVTNYCSNTQQPTLMINYQLSAQSLAAAAAAPSSSASSVNIPALQFACNVNADGSSSLFSPSSSSSTSALSSNLNSIHSVSSQYSTAVLALFIIACILRTTSFAMFHVNYDFGSSIFLISAALAPLNSGSSPSNNVALTFVELCRSYVSLLSGWDCTNDATNTLNYSSGAVTTQQTVSAIIIVMGLLVLIIAIVNAFINENSNPRIVKLTNALNVLSTLLSSVVVTVLLPPLISHTPSSSSSSTTQQVSALLAFAYIAVSFSALKLALDSSFRPFALRVHDKDPNLPEALTGADSCFKFFLRRITRGAFWREVNPDATTEHSATHRRRYHVLPSLALIFYVVAIIILSVSTMPAYRVNSNLSQNSTAVVAIAALGLVLTHLPSVAFLHAASAKYVHTSSVPNVFLRVFLLVFVLFVLLLPAVLGIVFLHLVLVNNSGDSAMSSIVWFAWLSSALAFTLLSMTVNYALSPSLSAQDRNDRDREYMADDANVDHDQDRDHHQHEEQANKNTMAVTIDKAVDTKANANVNVSANHDNDRADSDTLPPLRRDGTLRFAPNLSFDSSSTINSSTSSSSNVEMHVVQEHASQ